MAVRSFRYDEERAPAWAWWLMMLVGVIGIVVGLIVLAKPGDSLKALAVITGIFLLIDGIVEVVASLMRRTSNRGVVAVLGVLSVLIGIMLIRHPVGGIVAIALLIGFWLIAIGLVRVVAAFSVDEHRGWNLLVAAIELIAGIVIIANPNIGYATLALLTGISFIINGIGLFAFGWSMRNLLHHHHHEPHRHAGAAA